MMLSPERILSCCLVVLLLTGICLPIQVTAQQVVFLDFDTFTDTGDDPKDHVYSASERSAIVAGMNDKFFGFGMTFTDAAPTSGFYSTVYFNRGLSEADQIDFRNLDKSDTADVHIPKVMEAVGVGSGYSSSDLITASINIAAHETAHLQGVRHHDAFLLPGMGVPTPGIAAGFDPVFPGPTSASFTSMEIMALTTGLGMSPTTLLDSDLFFGPRSAVKLMMTDPPTTFTVDETTAPHNVFESPQFVDLKTIDIVNNLPPGVPGSGLDLLVDVAVVKDATIGIGLSGGPESDYYAIAGQAGDVFQIEVLSSILEYRFSDLLDPRVSVIPMSDPSAMIYYGTLFNNDEVESTDSLMIDLILPYDDTYIVEVWANPDAPTPMQTGQYELYMYRFRAIPEPTHGLVLAIGLGAVMSRRRKPSVR